MPNIQSIFSTSVTMVKKGGAKKKCVRNRVWALCMLLRLSPRLQRTWFPYWENSMFTCSTVLQFMIRLRQCSCHSLPDIEAQGRPKEFSPRAQEAKGPRATADG